MCGIAAIYLRGKRPGQTYDVDAAVDEMLKAIDPRGGHATGFATVRESDGAIRVQSAPVRAMRFRSLRRDVDNENVRCVLMHTRFATQGDPLLAENNHPIEYGGTVVVHNGVIMNDDSVFDTLAVERFADVDSESIAAALAVKGPDNAAEALEMVQGSLAIASVSAEAPYRLTLARGASSPLYVYVGKRLVLAASTIDAVKAGWSALTGQKEKHMRWTPTQTKEGAIMQVTRTTIKTLSFEPNYTTHAKQWSEYDDAWTTGKGWAPTPSKNDAWKSDWEETYKGSGVWRRKPAETLLIEPGDACQIPTAEADPSLDAKARCECCGQWGDLDDILPANETDDDTWTIEACPECRAAFGLTLVVA